MMQSASERQIDLLHERKLCSVAVAVVASAAISAGTQLAAGGASAAGSAIAAGDVAPYNQLGVNTLGPLNQLTMGGPTALATLQQTPGYQFTLQQGLQGVENGYAAQGLGRSGAALKGAANYAEGLAGTTYQQIWQNMYNQAALGENAAVGQGTFTQNAGSAVAGGLAGAGNTIGQGALLYGLLNKGTPGGDLGTNYSADQMAQINSLSMSGQDLGANPSYVAGE